MIIAFDFIKHNIPAKWSITGQKYSYADIIGMFIMCMISLVLYPIVGSVHPKDTIKILVQQKATPLKGCFHKF